MTITYKQEKMIREFVADLGGAEVRGRLLAQELDRPEIRSKKRLRSTPSRNQQQLLLHACSSWCCGARRTQAKKACAPHSRGANSPWAKGLRARKVCAVGPA